MSRLRGIARRGGSAAEVAYADERDAVSLGIAKDADTTAISATKRGQKVARAEKRYRQARGFADVAFEGDRDGDGDHDLSDDALAVLEDRAKDRYYAWRFDREDGAFEEVATLEGEAESSAFSSDILSDQTHAATPRMRASAMRPKSGRAILEGREGKPLRRAAASRDSRARHLGTRRSERASKRLDTRSLKERQRRANLQTAIASQREQQEAGAAAQAARAARKSSNKSVAAAVASVIPPLAGAAAAILAFVLAALLVSQIMGSLFGFWKNEDDKQRLVAGLPPYITYEMVVTALEMQEQYGHPAGATLAQIILESGVGDHLSGLATRDNNLFGIKWNPSFASCPEVTGYESWRTNEEYGGAIVTITDAFTCFASYKDCIVFRSRVFLQMGLYRNNAIIQRAIAERSSDLMVEGLKDAGYATSSEYVSSLKSVMDMYGLRRFDAMFKDDFDAEMAGGVTGVLLDGNATPRQQQVVAAAYAETYCVPKYCAEYVMRVYERCGISREYGGDARDIYWKWCTSSDLSTLKPGMVIAVPTHAGTEAGRIWGHVAVYVGGGMVRDNVGYLRMTPINDWISYYSSITAPKWGWYGGIPLA